VSAEARKRIMAAAQRCAEQGWPADELGEAFIDEGGVVHIVRRDGSPVASLPFDAYQRLRVSLGLEPAEVRADGGDA
jgi:uncharacterized protein GlcG (DUF336 family)